MLNCKCVLRVDRLYVQHGFGMGDSSRACTTKLLKWQQMSLCSWVWIWSLVQVSGLARVTSWSWLGCTRNRDGCAGRRMLVETDLPDFDPPLQIEELFHHVVQAASNWRCSCLSLTIPELRHRFEFTYLFTFFPFYLFSFWNKRIWKLKFLGLAIWCSSMTRVHCTKPAVSWGPVLRDRWRDCGSARRAGCYSQLEVETQGPENKEGDPVGYQRPKEELGKERHRAECLARPLSLSGSAQADMGSGGPNNSILILSPNTVRKNRSSAIE